MKKKKVWISLIAIIVLVAAGLIGAGMYFFNVACVPSKKNFISANSDVVKKSDP